MSEVDETNYTSTRLGKDEISTIVRDSSREETRRLLHEHKNTIAGEQSERTRKIVDERINAIIQRYKIAVICCAAIVSFFVGSIVTMLVFVHSKYNLAELAYPAEERLEQIINYFSSSLLEDEEKVIRDKLREELFLSVVVADTQRENLQRQVFSLTNDDELPNVSLKNFPTIYGSHGILTTGEHDGELAEYISDYVIGNPNKIISPQFKTLLEAMPDIYGFKRRIAKSPDDQEVDDPIKFEDVLTSRPGEIKAAGSVKVPVALRKLSEFEGRNTCVLNQVIDSNSAQAIVSYNKNKASPDESWHYDCPSQDIWPYVTLNLTARFGNGGRQAIDHVKLIGAYGTSDGAPFTLYVNDRVLEDLGVLSEIDNLPDDTEFYSRINSAQYSTFASSR